MKPDTVSLFKNAGHGEGGVESVRGGKGRKGQGGGAVGGATDFAKLLGHSAKQLASEDALPVVADRHDGQPHGDQHGAAESFAHTLSSGSGEQRHTEDGVNKRRRPMPGAPVAEPRLGERPVVAEAAPAQAASPSGWQAPVKREATTAQDHRATQARGPQAAPAAPSANRTPTAAPASAAVPAPAAAQAPVATPALVTAPSAKPAPAASAAATAPTVAPPVRSPAAAVQSPVAAPAAPGPTAVSPRAPVAAPVSTAAHPSSTATAPTPAKAPVAAPAVAGAPVAAAAPAVKTERPIPSTPARAAAPAAAAPQALPAQTEGIPSRAAEAPVAAQARDRGPAVPAPAGAPSRPAVPAAPQIENLAAPAPQSPPAAAKAAPPKPAPDAPRAPSQPSVPAEQRPAVVERRAPQASAPAQAAPAAPAVKAADKQVEQKPVADAPARTPQRPQAPVVQLPDQPVVAAPARSEQPVPAAPERDPSSSATHPVRIDRRPLRAARPEAQATNPEDGRKVEAPTEAPVVQRPLAQRAAMATLSGQPEIAETQPELRRAVEVQPGMPTAELTPGRPKLVRARERAAGEDEAADDRKLVRGAAEKELPNLLLMQLSAPIAAPPADLVNARLQMMARDGRRALESAAITATASDALLPSSGSDASKTGKPEHELPWQGPAVTVPLDATLPASLTGTTPVAEGPAAPPLPPAAAPLLDQAALDPGLNVAVMSKAAHVTITNDDGRALELHLRMSPEGADIRAAGNLAPMVQARVAELGMALASQGLTLGSFQMGRDGQGRSSRDDEDREPTRDEAPAGRRAIRANSATGAGPVTNVAGRIHVKV